SKCQRYSFLKALLGRQRCLVLTIYFPIYASALHVSELSCLPLGRVRGQREISPGFRLVNTDPVPQFGPKLLVLRDSQGPIPMRVAPNVLAIDTNRYNR